MRIWLTASAAVLREQRDYLTQLDAAIGDADHGTNMDRGFAAVVERLEGEDDSQPPGKLLLTAGSTLVSTVGGASGPSGGRPSGGPGGRSARRRPSDFDELAAALAARRRRRARCCQRGREDDGRRARARGTGAPRAHRGGGGPRGSARRRTRGERAGDAGNVPLQALGHASYLGERSIGHQDPGATSTALILAALERSAATAA